MMAWKDKATVVPLSNDPNNECAVGRTDYTIDEYTKVAECWIDISEDSITPTTRLRPGCGIALRSDTMR